MGIAQTIGILGGTFDPIHFGHLRLAEESYQQLGLTKVCFVPAGLPPHRNLPFAATEHRLEMVKKAVAGCDHFCVEDFETKRIEPSYTVNTLRYFRRIWGDHVSLVFIMGYDAFMGLAQWYQWEQILQLAHIAVSTRAGKTIQYQESSSDFMHYIQAHQTNSIASLHQQAFGKICHFSMTPLSISSTHIRSLLAQQNSIRYLVPNSVMDYIFDQQLYTIPHEYQ